MIVLLSTSMMKMEGHHLDEGNTMYTMRTDGTETPVSDTWMKQTNRQIVLTTMTCRATHSACGQWLVDYPDLEPTLPTVIPFYLIISAVLYYLFLG